MEEADDLIRYGKSKQHQPLPLVGIWIFLDYDGIPLSLRPLSGENEQPTLKPLEKEVIRDYGLKHVVVCTDAGLSSKIKRKFNDKTLNGVQILSFITTQSLKQLPQYLKEFVLDPDGCILQVLTRRITSMTLTTCKIIIKLLSEVSYFEQSKKQPINKPQLL